MPKINYYNAVFRQAKTILLRGLLTAVVFSSATAGYAQQGGVGELLEGYYAREGNNDSPAQTAGNNIYIKFFPDRWVAMMFIPYPYASKVDAPTVKQVFEAARKTTDGSSFLRGKYGQLEENATLQVERYGYLQDRIIFECGALSPCTIRLAENSLELIKPGIINEHIINYDHITTP